MHRTLVAILSLSSAFLIAAGCGSDSKTSDSSRAVCDTLINCGTALNKSEVTAWTTAYGKDGTCFKAATTDQCVAQCMTQVKNIWPSSSSSLSESEAKACGVSCTSNASCTSIDKDAKCNTTTKLCGSCLTDSDCTTAGEKCVGLTSAGSVACASSTVPCSCESNAADGGGGAG
jgi:hypothetical protein